MALPLAPLAFTVVRYGAVAAAVYYVAKRKNRSLPKDNEEKAHDDVAEGVSWVRHTSDDGVQANGDARYKRVVRFGPNGPGVEIDATALGRLRVKKVPRD